MRRKALPKIASVVSPEILEQAKRSVATDRTKGAAKCSVCGAEVGSIASDQLCWVCSRLKIRPRRAVEQQMPAQE